MKVRRSLLRYLYGTLSQNLPFLIISYILIPVLYFIFTGKSGRGFFFNFEEYNWADKFVLFVFIFLSSLLLFMMMINLFHLLVRETKLGINLIRRRIILFFVLLVFLSTIPQAILAYKLTNSSLDFWLDREFQDVLEESLDFNLNFYQLQLENLDRFHRNGSFEGMDLSSSEAALKVWESLSVYNGGIDALQVILSDGRTWLLGDELARVPVQLNNMGFEGFLARRDLEDFSLLSYQFNVSNQTEEYSVILTSFYPREYNLLGSQLSEMIGKMDSFQEMRDSGGLLILLNQFIFILPLLFLSINIGFALADRLTQPLDRLMQAMNHVARGDYQYRLTDGFTKELSPMVGSFNLMINELELSRAKEEQTGRVGAWKDLAQQLAHEIRNPLTPIKLSAQRILRKSEDFQDSQDVIEPAMKRIIHEVDGLDYLLKEFREFAGQRAPQLEEVELSVFLNEIADKYRHLYEKVNIERQGDRSLLILADRQQLSQVLTNLMDNAIQAMKKEGRISLGLYHIERGNMNYGRIIVQDSGPGIPEDQRDRIFKPYYTSRDEGTGLGLAIVDRIINDHRGRIWLVSTEEGSTFTIDIPTGDINEKSSDH